MRSWRRQLLLWCGGAVVLAALFVAWALARFGSLPLAAAWLRGEPLVLQPATFDAGVLAAGETAKLQLRVVNFTGQSVRIVGGTSSCTCVATEGLPLDCPANAAVEIPVTMRAPYGERTVRTTLSLYTDLPSASPLLARLSIAGSKPPEAAGGRDE